MSECRRFVFWRDTEERKETSSLKRIEGKLFVRETCWDPSTYRTVQFRTMIIDVLIEFGWLAAVNQH
jgi:hypothetical protein